MSNESMTLADSLRRITSEAIKNDIERGISEITDFALKRASEAAKQGKYETTISDERLSIHPVLCAVERALKANGFITRYACIDHSCGDAIMGNVAGYDSHELTLSWRS